MRRARLTRFELRRSCRRDVLVWPCSCSHTHWNACRASSLRTLDVTPWMRCSNCERRTEPRAPITGIREDGSVGAVEAALLPFATVEHATQSGITLAKGLLRVDQVISARGD